MADIRLKDFTAKTTPIGDDILYGANSSSLYTEVKFTINQMMSGYSAALSSIKGLTTNANQMLYTTASDTYAVSALTPFARTVLDDITSTEMRATIGVVIGTDVQPYNVALTSIAGLTTTANEMIYTTGANSYATSLLTPFARTLLDDPDAATMRDTLGVTTTGTALQIVNNLSDVASASVSRTNLGVEIGTNVQAYDATLQSLSGLGTGADKFVYTTGVDTWAESTVTPFARTLLDDPDAATMRDTLGVNTTGTALQIINNLSDVASASISRTNLGVEIGTNVQAYDATLQSLSSLGTAADKIPYSTAIDTWAETPLTPFARTLLDDADAASMRATLGVSPAGGSLLIANNLSDVANASSARTNLGVQIGSNVQAYDATLQSLSGLGSAADKFAYTTGVDTWAESTVTPFARTLLDDATAANAATTLSVLPLSGGTLTGNLFLPNSPTADTQAATKGYVDAVAQGLNPKPASSAATIAPLTVTYNNGSSGVGATLTNAGTQAAFVLDGYNASVGDVILVKDQTSSFQNGLYTISTLGSGSTNWVLRRSTSMDIAAEFIGGYTFVINGTVNAGKSFVETAAISTVGTDAVNFTQQAGNFALKGDNTDITSLTGLTGEIRYPTKITLADNPGNNSSILVNNNASTGKMLLQAGGGSAAFGGGLNLYGANHATKAGWVTAGLSSGAGASFSVNNQATGAGTELFKVDSTGLVTTAVAIPVTSGGTGGTSALSAALNLQNQGTFTVTYKAAAGAFGSITYARNDGYYIQIGKLVFINITLYLSAFTAGTASGQLSIIGLPFNSHPIASTNPLSVMYSSISASMSAYTQVTPCIVNSGSDIVLYFQNPNNTTRALGSVGLLQSTTQFYISGTFYSA